MHDTVAPFYRPAAGTPAALVPMVPMVPLVPLATPAGVPRRAPLHPGRFLERHYLEPLAITQTEAARRLGVSRRRVNELVQGRRSMTPDTAIRCAQLFGLPAALWLAMQSEWDSYAAWKQLRQAQRAPR